MVIYRGAFNYQESERCFLNRRDFGLKELVNESFAQVVINSHGNSLKMIINHHKTNKILKIPADRFSEFGNH